MILLKQGKMKNEKTLRASIDKLNKYGNSKSINVLVLIAPMIAFIILMMNELAKTNYSYSKNELEEGIAFCALLGLIIGVISVLAMHGYCDYKIGVYNSELIMLGIEDAKEDVDNDIYKNLIKIR